MNNNFFEGNEFDNIFRDLLENPNVRVRRYENGELIQDDFSELTNKKEENMSRNENIKALLENGRDLTKEAEDKLLDKVIGRDAEIQQVIEILSRKKKNNPVLLGEAGVGKTSIVEGLALKIVSDDVPNSLKGKKVIQLDIGNLVAGTELRGSFEKKLQEILKEATENKNIILFIDELHMIMGAGGTSQEDKNDVSNMLKPLLASGKLKLIGATTNSEYKNIEKDSAMARRFQKVVVKEPTEANTLEILKGLKKSYEDFHQVIYSDDALKSAVELSGRYMKERNNPDKSIDLIDITGAKIGLEAVIENSKEDFEKEIAKIEQLKEEAIRNENYKQAEKYKSKLQELGENLLKAKETNLEIERPVITRKDIELEVEKLTKIPVTAMEKEESEKLLKLDEKIKEKVIGQDSAVENVAMSVKRGRLGFNKPNKPIASFLFVGTTGVGKTELAKQLAQEIYGNSESYVRLDMSEYSDKMGLTKLIGSSAGYVGYGEGGLLTEKVKRNPYSLILLDEIEKAHDSIHKLLLQILDDGRVTDGEGNTIDFTNTIIIMTSNAGFSDNTSDLSLDEKLSLFFKPEFLNRIDDIIEFKPLTKDSVINIIDIIIEQYNRDILSKKDIKISLTKKAKEYLQEKGYSEKYGARELSRTFQKEIVDKLTMAYLKKDIRDKYTFDCKDDKIVLK